MKRQVNLDKENRNRKKTRTEKEIRKMKKLTLIVSVLLMIVPLTMANAGVVAMWEFDENSGNQALDSSGNGLTGTLQADDNAPAWVAGLSGSALSFGGNDGVDVAYDAVMNVAESLTIECFINFNGVDSNGTIFDRFPGTLPDRSYMFGVWGAALPKLRLIGRVQKADGSGQVNIQPGNLGIPNTGWHHIAFTWDGATGIIKSYVDYALDGQANTGYIGGPQATTTAGLIGGGNAGSIQATIDRLRISDVALDPQNFLQIPEPSMMLLIGSLFLIKKRK
jgi:Concanavalin A-like lectin/glucanases superfamily